MIRKNKPKTSKPKQKIKAKELIEQRTKFPKIKSFLKENEHYLEEEFKFILNKILETGDINIGINYNSALPLASFYGFYNLTKDLLEYGADPNLFYGVNSALHLAALTGNIDIAKLLLEKGANIDITIRRFVFSGWTPLSFAVENNHKHFVKFLLENGANIDGFPTMHFASALPSPVPFHIAAFYGNKEIAELLVEYGADIHIKDVNGENAFYYAIMSESAPMVKFLLDLGLDPKEKNHFGESSLRRLIATVKSEEIKELLIPLL